MITQNAKIKFLESLLVELDKLPNGDRHKLDALKRRAEMVVRNIFGENSKYLTDLKKIDFFPRVYPADEIYYNERWLSGVNNMLNLFKTMLEEVKLFQVDKINEAIEMDTKVTRNKDTEDQEKIFIVHGHDEAMQQAVARMLEKLKLKPIILHELPNKGRTIIEKFSDHSNVGFAIVLLSPDDIGYENIGSEAQKNAKTRARQNVVFEQGFFIGKLGRERVLALYKTDENFEMPTDYSGVLYVPYESNQRWKFDLAKELKACGYDIDANVLLE